MMRSWIVGLTALAAMLAPPSSEAAVTVKVLQTSFSFFDQVVGRLNDFYSAQPGITSSLISGPVTAADLANVDLFVALWPDVSFSASEIQAMSGLLNAHGRIYFGGENQAAIFAAVNANINAALTALGSGMQIITPGVQDSGFHTATKVNGQILNHALTDGVNMLTYAAPSGVGGVLGGNSLFLATDLVTTFGAYKSVGGGSIVLVPDLNIIWTDSSPPIPQDNDRFFLNVANVVPEPSTLIIWSVLGSLGIGLGWWRRRKAA